MTYVFHAAAQAEHVDNVVFYESRQIGLGAGYVDEFELAMAKICASPAIFRIIHPPAIRKFHLSRFPITIVFRLAGNVVLSDSWGNCWETAGMRGLSLNRRGLKTDFSKAMTWVGIQ